MHKKLDNIVLPKNLQLGLVRKFRHKWRGPFPTKIYLPFVALNLSWILLQHAVIAYFSTIDPRDTLDIYSFQCIYEIASVVGSELCSFRGLWDTYRCFGLGGG